LLGGVELYKDPLVALRELLQNALDAVKEHIACERLRLSNPGSPAWQQRLGEQHKVTLSLIQESDGLWLVCADDGVGMTRAIIERHLLVSGAPPLPEVHQLERDANAHGFSVGRSAQFGIGVLSYFMIADRMTITTRRSVLAGGDPDGTGWRFETEGLAGFGQLTPVVRSTHGSEVRLRIRPEATANVQADVMKYIKHSLVYAPCRVEVMSSGRGADIIGPGWCRTAKELVHRHNRKSPIWIEDMIVCRDAQGDRGRGWRR
jgi:HSP90 family molecular chaperone